MFRTFVDEESGIDEHPVAILLRRLQSQSRRQLVLQEGQRHALLQVVRGGGQPGRQPASAAGTAMFFLLSSRLHLIKTLAVRGED